MDYRVVIADAEPRRVVKIVTLSDGGYSVLAPYHNARKGWLAKHAIDYTAGAGMTLKRSEMVEYSADDQVKLSHHADGFVQFSGVSPQKIRSGRNPLTGEPKGLGLLSAPIRVPITTGPTFGLTCWGLDRFRPHAPTARDLIFEAQDIYYRRSDPKTFSGYMIEGWVFGERMWAGVRGSGMDLRLSMGFRNFEGSGANIDFRVMPLEGPSAQFLGIQISRIATNFPSESGFVLSSPSDRRAGATVANAMFAVYPRFEDMSPADATDLTFIPPVP